MPCDPASADSPNGILVSETTGLEAAHIMHSHVTTLAESATVGALRSYFAESTSRRLAVLVTGERYVGSVPAAAIPADAADTDPAVAYANREPVIASRAPADAARDLALNDPSRRVPVVDEAGLLVGIVALDAQLTRFCGT